MWKGFELYRTRHWISILIARTKLFERGTPCWLRSQGRFHPVELGTRMEPCGDVMKLQIKVDEEGNIVDSCFKTFGCGSAIASSSVATEWVKGRPMEEVLTIKNSDIAKHLSLPPVKLHCSMLAEDAIKAAVKDYKDKKAKAAGQGSRDELAEAAA
ncbi:hypothetical protein R1flu_009958 [Riccia fluitans]|uniref:NIF system FeS cluster assembly NifU N-terminal domain-containing protein n=1 Tax=Riccia fluitans TaxID=41844 RepID=A0ABD1Z3M6_9MARC